MLTLDHIYRLALRNAIASDLRGPVAVRKKLAQERKKYDAMSRSDRSYYDQECLTNPYADSRVYVGKPDRPIRRIMAGIDITGSELLAAQALAPKRPVDLVIAHHPHGSALAALNDVMHMQAEIYSLYGVPITRAEALQRVRISEVARSISSLNHYKTVDLAKLLDIPFMTAHTFTDNLVADFLKKLIDRNRRKLETVGDLLDLLMTIPEYQIARRQKSGPKILAGQADNSLGKIALTEITGGTEGTKEIYQHLANAGVGTIVGMHMSEEHKKQAEQNHLNVIIAGHMSSDSIGLNLLLDELAKHRIDIIPCGGLIRVSRSGRTKSSRS